MPIFPHLPLVNVSWYFRTCLIRSAWKVWTSIWIWCFCWC